MKIVLFLLFFCVSAFAVNLNIDVCKNNGNICYHYFIKDVKDYSYIQNKTYLRIKFYDKRELDIGVYNSTVDIRKSK